MAHLVEAPVHPPLGINVNTFDTVTVETIPQPRTIDRPKKVDRVFTPSHRRIMVEWPLVEKAMAGDADSFGQLYDYYQPRVYKYLYGKTRNFADAQDLTSGVFLRAWRGMGRYQPRGFTFGVWLGRIAHNNLVDYYESQRPAISLEKADLSSNDAADPFYQAEKRSEIGELRQAIQKLTPDQQTVVQMRLQDLDNKEIAQALGKTEGAVKSLFHRSILNLRDRLV